MIPPTHPHGREDLSALFDGELHGDASRFAHKRLAQDVQWRQACGTWQLVGDVLRGHATAAAPAGFADRVQLALANESAAATSAPSGYRRGWVGGAALAASVAIAAWFVASPLDEAAPTIAPAATVATAAPPRAVPETAPALPSAALAAADTASREGIRPSRVQAERMAPPESRPRAAVVAAAAPTPAAGQPLPSAPAASADPGGIDATALADPFQLPTARLAPKPWPRAVLPNYPVTGALTAGYGVRTQNPGVAASGATGFYPFEPRLPPDVDAAAASDAQ